MKRSALSAVALLTSAFSIAPALGLDLNSFRAQHGRPPLSLSGALAGAAYSHAQSLAGRQRLDHAGFRQRVPVTSGTAAENVAFGCATEDCVSAVRPPPRKYAPARRDQLRTCIGGRREWRMLRVLDLGN